MQNPNGKECVRCHLEHNGENFNLIHWEPSKTQFDHRQTGYKLEGKHAGPACEKCHAPAFMIGTIRPLIKMKDPARSYLGLTADCVPCHQDVHKGQLGKDCLSCHNFADWKEANNKFDHSKTRYPLTGEHIKVACDKCHKPDVPGGPVRYRDMKFQFCIDCHIDPHKGSFKQKCEECHTVAGWKKLLPPFSFDHSKTKYPLLGKHKTVGCDDCHLKGDFKKELHFANCMDCHKDVHKGQFTARPKKGECAECHSVEDWKPSSFGVKEHDTSKYPLRGKHIKVECDKCHLPAGKDTIYKVKFAACLDCHKDAHDNQFAAAPYHNACEPCHTVQDWHRPTFTVAMHRKTRYQLTGAHAAVPCSDCHKVGLAGRTDKVLPFHFADMSCTACHKDPHHGEFNDRMAQQRADGSPLGCEACHDTRSWANISGFDHSKTKFPLLGAHRVVKCGDCHKVPPGGTQIQFKGTSQVCEDCHKDVHAGQFAKAGKTPCEDCHNSQRWIPSTFDHDTRTHFPLQGGHAGVACNKCHTQTRAVGGKAVIIYKQAPSKCTDCHGPDVKPLKPQKPANMNS